MNRQVRTTLVFGFFCAMMFLPLGFIPDYWAWQSAARVFAVVSLTVYSAMLCRWSGTSLASLFFPLLALGATAVWFHSQLGFMIISLLIFSWIRSGVCYRRYPLRAMVAESVSILTGSFYLLFFQPQSTLAQALTVWLFFLFQALYFYIVPTRPEQQQEREVDPFDNACSEMEQILNQE